MKYRAKVFKYGDDVNTDEIIPARYLNTSDPDELAAHCMEDIDADFVQKMKKGDIILAGKNFGCGSSREHAPISIKAIGVSCIIARSFARIFYRNCINIGLPIFECPEAAKEINDSDMVEVDPAEGEIMNITQGKTYQVKPLPPFIREIIQSQGLIPWVQKKFMEVNNNGSKL